MMVRMFAWCVAATVLIAGVACTRDEPQPNTAATAQPQATTPRDDASITTSVQARYYGTDEVRGQAVSVSTRDGVVTLSGTVRSEEAKQRALQLAREVEGVTRVDDQLRVAAPAEATASAPRAQEQTEGTSGATLEPEWITTKIQAQYFLDPELKPWNIDVTTGTEGVVTLEGEVEAQEDKAEAVRIARETEGVSRVDDRLRLKGNSNTADAAPSAAASERPDGWLTAKIQSKYFLDDLVKGHEINVETNNGTVTLNGTIGSEAQRRQALALARNTDGVRQVVDRLRVEAQAGGSTGATGTVRPVEPLTRPDEWITTKVQAQYFLDQTVRARRIDVDTAKGVVTLTGTVESAEEKQQAEQIARDTEGVRRVVNRLTIAGGRE